MVSIFLWLRALFIRRRYVVSQALDEYAADFALRGCRSMKSLRSEIATLKKRVGDLPVVDLTMSALREYQSLRHDDGVAAATVNKEMAVLSAALQLAETNERVASIPKFPRRLRPAAPRQGFLEDADYLAIRAELPDWGKPVLDFGWYSGWRRGEILGLTREEVDLAVPEIRLHPDRSKNGISRKLPLLDFGLEAIQVGLSTPGDTVFHLPNGQPISSTHWHQTWRAAVAAAGRPRVLFHDLRRSVVRRLEDNSVSRKTAMAWVGHKTESIYWRYCITTARDLTRAAEKMIRSLRPQEGDRKIFRMFPPKKS